jgi:large subunit ribosomal protein L11
MVSFIMIIRLLVNGGEMKPGPSLSQKLGPIGINMGKVISEVNKATVGFKGIKVPVSLDIDTKTKNFSVQVFTPPASELLKREFGLEKGSGQPDKIKVANAAIENIIKIAKEKEPDMLANNFKSAVKSILGSCVSLGILVESKDPKEIMKEVDQGKYDGEIKKQATEPSAEKLEKLNTEFEEVKREQDALIKAIEEKKAKEAEAAAAPAEGEAGETAQPEKEAEEKEEK